MDATHSKHSLDLLDLNSFTLCLLSWPTNGLCAAKKKKKTIRGGGVATRKWRWGWGSIKSSVNPSTACGPSLSPVSYLGKQSKLEFQSKNSVVLCSKLSLR